MELHQTVKVKTTFLVIYMAAAPPAPLLFLLAPSFVPYKPGLLSLESIKKMKEAQLVSLFETEMRSSGAKLLTAIKNYKQIPAPVLLNRALANIAIQLNTVLVVMKEIQSRPPTPASPLVLVRLKQIWSNVFRKTLEWELRLGRLVNAGSLIDMIPDEFDGLYEDSVHQMIRTAINIKNFSIAAFYITNVKAKNWRALYAFNSLSNDPRWIANVLNKVISHDALAALQLALAMPDSLSKKAEWISDVCKACGIIAEETIGYMFVNRYVKNPKPSFGKQFIIGYETKRGIVRESLHALQVRLHMGKRYIFLVNEETISNSDVVISEVFPFTKISGTWQKRTETAYHIRMPIEEHAPH